MNVPHGPEIHQVGESTREILISREDCPAFADAGISLAGISEAKFGFSFVRHRPGFIQIMACQKGEGRVWFENRWERCGPGQVFATPAGVPHAYHAVRGRSWRLTWLMFVAPVPTLVQPRLIAWDSQGMADTVHALHRECVSLRSPILMRQLVDILVFYQHRVLDPSASDERLLKLWAGVHALLHEAWDLNRLARQSYMSAEHLRRLCRNHYRRSPMALLRDMRMRRAATLLQRTSLPIDEVAAQVGYSDGFAFSKAFKRFFRVNPSQQRKLASGAASSNNVDGT